MASMRRGKSWWLLAVVLLLLSGCSFLISKSPKGMVKQSYYLDANLKFTVSYPETWHRVPAPAASPY